MAEKSPWFIKVAPGQVFNRSEIRSVRRTRTPSVGKDKVERSWVLTVSPESVGGVSFSRIWLTEAEAERLCGLLGVEYDPPKAKPPEEPL